MSGAGATAPHPAHVAAPVAPLHVLLVEDNPGDAELMAEMLQDDVPDVASFTIRHVARLADARAELDRSPVDVVLLDLSLPDSHGLDSLQTLRAVAPELPVVVMTGLADDEVALRAVQAGAQDYLVKGRDAAGAVRRAVRYAVERQRLIRAAQHASAARDEMLGVVSHDLRNPIGTIGMCAQALLDPDPVPPENAREMGAIIERSCDWMLRLIGDLLDVTRMEAGVLALQLDPLPVAGVVASLLEMYGPLAERRGVSLQAFVAPDMPRVYGDGDRIFQALGNLVANAVKFTPAEGEVTITVESVENGAEDGDAGIIFHVSDTGPGIAAEAQAHLFDRFWQARSAHRGGAGLGLAIARAIMLAHGGTIDVRSTPGVGTIFSCSFPPAPAQTPTPPA